MQPKRPSQGIILLALGTVQLLFGVNYAISKVVVAAFPPLVWASIRIAIASVFMVIFALLLKRPHPPMNRKFFVPLIAFSLLGAIINQSCFLVGLRHTTPTNSAVLNTLIPVFTLLFVTIRGIEPLTPKKLLGFIFAAAGVLSLLKVEQFSFSDETLLGDGLTLVNSLSYSLFLVLGKRFVESFDRVWTTAWIFMYGTIGIGLISIPSWQGFVWPEMSFGLWWAAGFAIFGATLSTYFLSTWTLAYAKSTQVALFIYVQPVIAALLGWAWHGDVPTVRAALSSLLIFVGMLLAIRMAPSVPASPIPAVPSK